MMRRLGTIVRKNKRYIWIGLALMLLGIFLGYTNAEAIKQAAKQMMDSIQRIAKHINDANNPLYTFWVIFENNVIAAFSMVGLGIFFLGLYPALGLITNGILLGFLLKVYANGGVNPLKIFWLEFCPMGFWSLVRLFLLQQLVLSLVF